MIVAMRAVNVMAVTFDDVVDVPVVLHGLVSAARTMNVLRIVTLTNMIAVLRAHASFYGPE